jgi:hypothetical protein
MEVNVKILNNSRANQEIEYEISESPGFLLSGKRIGSASILPLSSIDINFNLTPIQAGFLTLPKVTVHSQKLDQKFIPSGSRQILSINQVL